MGKSTTAHLSDKDKQLTVSAHESDAPLLPMAQIERLHALCPERVPWVFDEATKEGDYRRAETRRVNTLVFVEPLLGVFSGLLIGIVGLLVAYYMAVAGHPGTAAVIGGTTVVSLIGAFLFRGRRQSSGREPANN